MQRFSLALAALFLIAAGSCARAAESSAAFTNPEKAGPDFKIQGEYLGELNDERGTNKLGMQVIALGDGEFQAVAYLGGLPGDGWSRGDRKSVGEGKIEGDTIKFHDLNSSAIATAVFKGDEVKVDRNGTPAAELKKVNRKSPTLGAKPPKDAIVLFDGSSVSEWEGGEIVEKDLLAATNPTTKKKFGDHHLHIEFRTPFMPGARGQGRGNSGVYVQGRYECQVLDSFGLEGENNECGGIYQIAKPAVNMCFPPLAWQTYDIDFTAAKYDADGKKTKNPRVTIKHNGVTIHDDLELTRGTPGHDPEGPDPDSLYLQNHGNPVVFRNIWVVEK